MNKAPTTLIIMDGFGLTGPGPGNAVSLAQTPQLDRLFAEYAHTTLSASGLDVGLPAGQMGNSEVGHTNIGGGRVVFQDLPRISRAIDDGSFFENAAYNKAMDDCLEKGSSLHLYGLLSDGGVHSHIQHLYALLQMAKNKGLTRVYLWMGWKLQMQPGEIASLTWGQVDFDQNLIRLPDRTVSMGSRLRRLLLDAWDRRKDPAEPRVFTAPTTGRPMDLSRLTTVTRTALIRGGLEHVNLRNLHAWVRQGDRAQLLMAQAEEQGWLTREAVMERLGVSKSTARQYLLELREAGRLVRVGTRYYPAGAVADPDDHLDIIRAYLQEHGTGRRQDFIRLLGLEPEQGTLLLRRLTDRGELVLTGRHYTLPEQEK